MLDGAAGVADPDRMDVDVRPVAAVAAGSRLYLAVMHSAVTLAPAVGRLIARELVDGTVEPALAGCRLDRCC